MSDPINALVITNPDAILVRSSDDATLHKLGAQFLETAEMSKGINIRLAAIIYLAWSIYCRRGKESQFGTWVSRYTELSRTQVHRLRLVFECFAPTKLNCFTLEQLPNLSELDEQLRNVKLTALYHLSRPTTPPEARAEALAEAKSSIVTPARALEIIDKHKVPTFALTKENTESTPRKKTTTRKTIDVDGGGKVVVRSADGDLLKTLKSAVRILERSQTTAS